MKEILKNPYYEAVCPYCGCLFKFDSKDIRYNDYHECYAVDCPNCYESITVKNRNKLLLSCIKVRYKEPKEDK